MVGKAEFKLDESVVSLQDLKSLIIEIQQYARWFLHNSIKKQAGAKSRKASIQPELTQAAQNVIKAWSGRQTINQKLLDELIETLEDYAQNAPQFTIVLAALPPASLKKTIVGWCRQNVSPSMLVNFQFNSTILGGMVVRCGSRIYDWSFKREITANAQKFPEILRNV